MLDMGIVSGKSLNFHEKEYRNGRFRLSREKGNNVKPFLSNLLHCLPKTSLGGGLPLTKRG